MSEFEQNWLGLGKFRRTVNLEQLARFKDDDSAFKFVCYLDTIVTAVRRQTLSIAGIVAD